jgi:hypothetical protein
MIGEYALEPEMIAAWCTDHYKCKFFQNQFGTAQGRLPSRYPKRWGKKVLDAFAGGSDMDKKRLTELLIRLQETMVKRKDITWDENATWLENAVREHGRHPFSAILARNNTKIIPGVICEADTDPPCPDWDRPHGRSVGRNVLEMVEAVKSMLLCCRWVKFVDPYISPGRPDYRPSLEAFLKILADERPVGLPSFIEIHTGLHDATEIFLKEKYIHIIPDGLSVTLYQWEARPNEQELHNRYILTDIGGVAFLHGLDISQRNISKDDIFRLAYDQYELHCNEYNPENPAFKKAADPIRIKGNEI